MNLADGAVTVVNYVTSNLSPLHRLLSSVAGVSDLPEKENRFTCLSGVNIEYRDWGSVSTEESPEFTNISLTEVTYQDFPDVAVVAATAHIADETLEAVITDSDGDIGTALTERMRTWWGNTLDGDDVSYVASVDDNAQSRHVPPVVSTWRLLADPPIEIEGIEAEDLEASYADRKLAHAFRRQPLYQNLSVHDNSPLSITKAYPNQLVSVADTGPGNIPHRTYTIIEICDQGGLDKPPHVDPYHTVLTTTSCQMVDALIPSLFCYNWLRGSLSKLRTLQKKLRSQNFADLAHDQSNEEVTVKAERFRAIESQFYDEYSQNLFYKDYIAQWVNVFPRSLLGSQPNEELPIPAGSLVDRETNEPVKVAPLEQLNSRVQNLLSVVNRNAQSMRESIDSTAAHVQRLATLELSSANVNLQRWARRITVILVVIGALQLLVTVIGSDTLNEWGRVILGWWEAVINNTR